MKREEIIRLTAGRDIDALISKHILREKILDVDFMFSYARKVWKKQPSTRVFFPGFIAVISGNTTTFLQQFKPYSTDIDSAWEVVEKIRERSFYITIGESAAQPALSIDGIYGQWACIIGLNDGKSDPVVTAQAGSVALAICRAALLLVLKCQ